MKLTSASSQLPSKIIYPTDFFPHQDKTQQAMVEEFVTILKDFLNVKKTEMSFTEQWAREPPSEAEGKSLEEYLKMARTASQVSLYGNLTHQYPERAMANVL